MDVRLLGTVELRGADGVVRLPRSAERCVLASLALSPGRPVSASTLVDNIWSATQSDRAIETVAGYVRKVRAGIKKAGGRPEWLRTDRGTHSYVLDIDPMLVDYFRFADLVETANRTDDVAVWEQALSLWRGRALADVSGLWADHRRFSVETERLDAYGALFTHLLRAGRFLEVARTATALIDELPPTEQLLWFGAQGLAGAGQHAAIAGWVRRAVARMRETVGVEPSADVLAEIEQLITGPTPLPRIAAPLDVPASAMMSLQGDIPAFTGRAEELAELTGSVRRDLGATGGRAVTVYAVDGMAGVGKTAFVSHAAHRLAPDYPDGQLFVELHGHTPGQRRVAPAEALTSLLLATGLDPKVIPAKLDDRARLWRNQIAGKRILLVLDDAADHEQVRPLLPGTPGSLVLVTSRHRLAALDGVRPLTLEVPSAAQAIGMLLRLANLDPDRADAGAAEDIVTLCGQLPLAIALVAGRLRSHPSWSMRYLAEELARAHDRLEHLVAGDRSVAAAFDMSFQDLPAQQQRLFRLLGAHPGPEIDAHAVAALLDEPVERARAGLDLLHTDHLIQETTPGRYRLHDLLRAYARVKSTEDSPADADHAMARVLRYYLRTVEAANAVLPAPTAPNRPAESRFTDEASAREWLGAELRTLATSVKVCAEGKHAEAAIALAAALQPFLRIGGHWERAVLIHSAARAAAERIGDVRGEAVSATNLGVVLALLGEYREAADQQQRAHVLFGGIGDRHGQAGALNELGRVQWYRGEYVRASNTLDVAQRLYTELDDQPGRAAALGNLSRVEWTRGEYPRVTETLTAAHQLHIELGDRLGQAQCLNDLGMVQWCLGDFAEATKMLTAAHRLFTELDDRLGQATARNNLGRVYLLLGDHNSAEQALTESYDLYRLLGARLGESNTLIDLGRVELARDRLVRAEHAFDAALRLCVELDLRHSQAIILSNLGVLRHRQGRHPKAAETLRTAYGQLVEFGALDDEVDALIRLGDLAIDHPQAGDPLDYFGRALGLASRIGLALQKAHALAGQGRALLLRGERATAVEKLTQAQAAYRLLGVPNRHDIAELLANESVRTG